MTNDEVREEIVRECRRIEQILLEKNTKYGNSALDPIRVFAWDIAPDRQLDIRIDDKLSRVVRGKGKDDEDVLLDLIGYIVLKKIYYRMTEKEGTWKKLNRKWKLLRNLLIG